MTGATHDFSFFIRGLQDHHETIESRVGSTPRHTCEGDKENLIHLCVRLRLSRTVVRNSKSFISTLGSPCNSSFSGFANNRKLKPHSLLEI